MPDEGRRGVAGHVQLGGEAPQQRVILRLAAQQALDGALMAEGGKAHHGIAGDKAVRARGNAFDRVFRIGIARVIERRRGAAQMAACREAQYRDLLIAHAAHKANGALRIGERRFVMAGLDAIIQHIRGHARLVEHFGDVAALVIGLHAIAAAGADHHRALRAVRGIGQKRGLALLGAVLSIGRVARPQLDGFMIENQIHKRFTPLSVFFI